MMKTSDMFLTSSAVTRWFLCLARGFGLVSSEFLLWKNRRVVNALMGEVPVEMFVFFGLRDDPPSYLCHFQIVNDHSAILSSFVRYTKDNFV